jgi:uncharacterized integral membrane protein
MGFEELFENKDRYQENNRERRYPGSNRYVHESQRSSHGQDENLNWLNILQKIRSNKKLKLFVILGGLLVLIILIVLIIVLLPVILKLINSISQTGLQGILNDITDFLNKILKGTAN